MSTTNEDSGQQLASGSHQAREQELHQQSFAFAAVVELSDLIHRLLWDGSSDAARTKMYTKSLFVFDSDNLEKAYPRKKMLPALERMRNFLLPQNSEEPRRLYPIISQVIKLSSYLRKHPALLSDVTGQLFELNKGLNDHKRGQISTILQVASIYSDTLSQLPQRKRIKISGSRRHINNPNVAQTVRTLLLASVRASLVWHRLGGRSWHLIVARKKLLAANEQLIVQTST